MSDLKKISEQFSEQGYIILRQFLSEEKITMIYQEIEDIFNMSLGKNNEQNNLKNVNDKYLWLKKNKPILKSNCYNLLGQLPSLNQAFYSSEVISLVKEILQTGVIVDKIQVRIDDSSNDRILPMHQERGQISLHEITGWLPLVDINYISGGVKFIADSHKLGDVGVQVYDQLKQYTGVPEQYLQSGEIIQPEMKAGDLLLFHWDLIHGSVPNQEGIRWTGVARYNSIENVPYLTNNEAPMHIPKNIVG